MKKLRIRKKFFRDVYYIQECVAIGFLINKWERYYETPEWEYYFEAQEWLTDYLKGLQ